MFYIIQVKYQTLYYYYCYLNKSHLLKYFALVYYIQTIQLTLIADDPIEPSIITYSNLANLEDKNLNVNYSQQYNFIQRNNISIKKISS